jgi:hypothetical protein
LKTAFRVSNNQDPTMAKPTIEPAAPYENLHLVARDYLDRLRQSLDTLQQPDDPALRWRNVHTMAQVNARLAQAGELLDKLTTTTK